MFDPLKPKLVQIIFKHSVRTAKETHHVTITKISCLMTFKEIIVVYSEKNTKPINTIFVQKSELLKVKEEVDHI
jgi:hypothetical protein